jgi:hypothetical protein
MAGLASDGIFIVGCDRSGTTLIQAMLNAHPRISIAYESGLPVDLHGRFARLTRPDIPEFAGQVIDNPAFARCDRDTLVQALNALDTIDFTSCMRVVFQVRAGLEGKDLWGDKSPGYCRRVEFLAEKFPRARFVHIHRNPHEVAPSIVRQAWGPNDVLHAARFWRNRVGCLVCAIRQLDRERAHHVCYEQFVAAPEAEIARLCAFLGVTPHEDMLDGGARLRAIPERVRDLHRGVGGPIMDQPHGRNGMMSRTDVKVIDRVCGDLMDELGYARRSGACGGHVPLVQVVRYSLQGRLRSYMSSRPR